jgi:hypothetical protein
MKSSILMSALFAGGAIAVFAAPAALAQEAQMPAPQVRAGYEPPRLSTGRPQIEGIWSNATTTDLERPAEFGERLVMTPQELAETEQSTFERNARQNAPTSQETFETWKEVALEPDTSDECRSGSRGAACGYNAGWTDPGDLVMRVNGEPRTSFITFPANGRRPAEVAADAARGPQVETGEGGPALLRANQNDNPEGRSLAERCVIMGAMSGPVMHPGLYNNTYRIVQSENAVAIWVEMIHDVRIVRLNDQHRTDGVKTYMGDSIGWWDGDTLVIETTGYHPDQNTRGGSENMVVTERLTRVAADRLHYAFKVEDPSVWVEPWGGEYEFSETNGIYEYACHESNYGLENILAGARYEESQAAAGGPQATR